MSDPIHEISNVSRKKLEGFLLALKKRSGENLDTKITPQTRESNTFPLTFAQQRLWFLHQLESRSTAYHLPFAWHLRGPLNRSALEASLNDMVTRHDTLRATFPSVEGQPVQVIGSFAPIILPLVDLNPFPEPIREAEVTRLIQETASQPFDLSTGPLWRATLLGLEKDEHIFLVTLHHIITDGWSMGIFWRELTALYTANVTGQPADLPPLPIQYTDFAVRQQQWLRGETLEQCLTYWRAQLAGAPATLDLPTDFPRPLHLSHRGAVQEKTLSPSLTADLKLLSERERVTLFMTLVVALNLLLARQTGQDDVVIGTPIAGRSQQELEDLIGFFVNTVVLRSRVSEHFSFQRFLKQVRHTCLEAYEHQEAPFEKLVEELQPERDLSRTPLFQVFINMFNLDRTPFTLSGMQVERIRGRDPESKFDLTVYLQETHKGLQVRMVYNANLFTDSRVVHWLDQYEAILRQIVATPDRTLAEYSLVTVSSTRFLPDPTLPLEEPQQDCLTYLIHRQAEKSPHHTAICQSDHTWSYQELVNQADALSLDLCQQGLQPGEVVAIGGTRSFGLIVALLGILQAGGVIMPLDSRIPIQRQRLMRQIGHVKRFLWVDKNLPDGFAPEAEQELALYRVDPDKGMILDEQPSSSLHALRPFPNPDDPAYVFFTSGTTGVPKGILGKHKSLSHFLTWQAQTFHVGSQDRVAQLTSLSFDPVLRDIFLPLICGATLCLPVEEIEQDLSGVLPWIEQEHISILHTVPTVAQFWLDQAPGSLQLSSLRWVFFSGEPLTDVLVKEWRKVVAGDGRLVNFYGPTETTLIKCWHVILDDPTAGVQPIGSPLPQTQALLVKNKRHLCGLGEIGEIVLRTPFGTFGYINGPTEQQVCFRRNPYRDNPDDVWYFTGDRGRYRLDGSLEILGRIDDQIKISGVRIEPDEITAILHGHPDLKAAVVLGYRGDETHNFLVAYVVPKPETRPTEELVRSYLVSRVPTTMLPAAIVFLDALPVTPNGKVDRDALPPPELMPTNRSTSYVEPATPIEKECAHILADLLKLERVGIHDNFFDVGGHSLLAMQVVNRIQKTFGVQFPVIQIFENPSIAKWARYIESAKNESPLPLTQQPTIPSPDREEGLL